MGLKRDLLHHLDPVRWAHDSYGDWLSLDEWQREVLTSGEPREIVLASRQSGKTLTCSLAAIHAALYPQRRGGALIPILSPSIRQSTEMSRTIQDLFSELPDPPEFEEVSKMSLKLANGSRIVALPSTEKVRGLSAPDIIVLEEMAYIPDIIISTVVLPMVATRADARIVGITTPFGTRGFVWRAFTEDGFDQWKRHKITAHEVPRISAAYLDDMRKIMAEWEYRQEFMCSFEDLESGLSVFRAQEWMDCLSNEVTALNLDSLLAESVV